MSLLFNHSPNAIYLSSVLMGGKSRTILHSSNNKMPIILCYILCISVSQHMCIHFQTIPYTNAGLEYSKSKIPCVPGNNNYFTKFFMILIISLVCRLCLFQASINSLKVLKIMKNSIIFIYFCDCMPDSVFMLHMRMLS